MTILHYFLGFPPYRSGGMTKFAYDLMEAQVKDGESVIALWPGRMNFILPPKVKIKKRKNINKIENYEIINAQPVSLDEGIKDVSEFIKECDCNIYIRFLEEIKPDAIHIHTLIGIHKEFIDAANKLGIKTVFTTHDYFGICPKVTLYKNSGVCENDNNCKDCINCNKSALSIEKIKIMQSPFYRKFKDSRLLKLLRKKHRNKFFNKYKQDFNEDDYKDGKSKEYEKLRKYYVEILENIDIIHFNSNLTKEVYLRYIKPKSYQVITISHKNIEDNRKNKTIASDKIRFTFLASTKPYKGFYMLKKVMDELYNKKKYEFELNIFSDVTERSQYMNVHKEGFKQEDLPKIFENTDILIAPSMWYETFGFTVIEALSYGVPVIVSDRVGAKDIIKDGGIIIGSDYEENLKKTLESMNTEKIQKMKKYIQKEIVPKKWSEFCEEIKKLWSIEENEECNNNIKL